MCKMFSVWVGGTEVTDYYSTIDEAIRIADEYIDDGYEDVHIVERKG